MAELPLDGCALALALSSAGNALAAAGSLGAIKVWELLDYCVTHTLLHEATVNALTFTLDGAFLVSADADSHARVWEVTNTSNVRALPHSSSVLSLALAPMRKQGNATAATPPTILVSGCLDGIISIWNVDSGALALLPYPPLLSARTRRHEPCAHCDGHDARYVAPIGAGLELLTLPAAQGSSKRP